MTKISSPSGMRLWSYIGSADFFIVGLYDFKFSGLNHIEIRQFFPSEY